MGASEEALLKSHPIENKQSMKKEASNPIHAEVHCHITSNVEAVWTGAFETGGRCTIMHLHALHLVGRARARAIRRRLLPYYPYRRVGIIRAGAVRGGNHRSQQRVSQDFVRVQALDSSTNPEAATCRPFASRWGSRPSRGASPPRRRHSEGVVHVN